MSCDERGHLATTTVVDAFANAWRSRRLPTGRFVDALLHELRPNLEDATFEHRSSNRDPSDVSRVNAVRVIVENREIGDLSNFD